MKQLSPGVEAWLAYLKRCEPDLCRLCDGVIGPEATLRNCCICSRRVITSKAPGGGTQLVAVTPAQVRQQLELLA